MIDKLFKLFGYEKIKSSVNKVVLSHYLEENNITHDEITDLKYLLQKQVNFHKSQEGAFKILSYQYEEKIEKLTNSDKKEYESIKQRYHEVDKKNTNYKNLLIKLKSLTE